jgi:hypothetical protein
MSFPKCIEYHSHTPRGIIICFHGGCFTGGKITYDVEQNNMLSDMGFIVYQPEFPKRYSEFKEWCQTYIPPFQKRTLPLYVLGRSSGGYLAKYVYNNFKFIQGAIYLCPILFPTARYTLKPQFMSKTVAFFDEEEEDMSTCTDNEYLIIGKNDQNIPYHLFNNVTGGNFYVDDQNMSHSQILTKSDADFKGVIEQIYMNL